MPVTDRIAWIDLETTGSDINYEEIIEVGLAITDDKLNILDEYAWVIGDLDYQDRLLRMDDVVIDMHTKSGLLADVLKSGTGTGNIQDVDEQVSAILTNLGGGQHIPLAGSGVLHFDRQFIKKFMPKTNKRLTYWGLDVGVVRRFLRLAGVPIPNSGNLTHRALEDVRAHIAEAKQYLDYFSNGVFVVVPEEVA